MGITAVRERLGRLLGRGSDVESDSFVPPTVLDRALTDEEDAALRWILWVEDFPGAEELRAQVLHVRVVFGRTTELGLKVSGAQRATVSDGILPVEAFVV